MKFTKEPGALRQAIEGFAAHPDERFARVAAKPVRFLELSPSFGKLDQDLGIFCLTAAFVALFSGLRAFGSGGRRQSPSNPILAVRFLLNRRQDEGIGDVVDRDARCRGRRLTQDDLGRGSRNRLRRAVKLVAKAAVAGWLLRRFVLRGDLPGVDWVAKRLGTDSQTATR